MPELTTAQQLAVFERVRALITEQRNHATYAHAKNNRLTADILSADSLRNANRFSIRGAICWVLLDMEMEEWQLNHPTEVGLSLMMLNVINMRTDFPSRLDNYNDSTEHADILKGLDVVIDSLRTKQKNDA